MRAIAITLLVSLLISGTHAAEIPMPTVGGVCVIGEVYPEDQTVEQLMTIRAACARLHNDGLLSSDVWEENDNQLRNELSKRSVFFF